MSAYVSEGTMKKISSWVRDNCRFAQKKDEDTKPSYVQWMSSDSKHFFPAAPVVKELKPGYYAIVQGMEGLFFTKLAMANEDVIKFPQTNSDEVVEEIEKFWESESAFRDAGIAYKRGMILYGPPGSGKTSTIKLVIENVVKRGGVVLKFARPGEFVSGYTVLREIQPDTPIVCLMEDIDAILDRCSESDLLNILDGVVPVDKIVFIATTNYPERLGSRIMNRPSRFDRRFEIGMPNAETRRLYLKRLLGDKKSDKEIEKWVSDTGGLSLAHLKELFTSVMIIGSAYDDTLATLKGMKQKIYSDEYKEEHGMIGG